MRDDAAYLRRRYVSAMPSPARRLAALLPRLDLVRVDELVALLLLVEIELQGWLSPYVSERLWAGLAVAALSAGVAVRRRWPLGSVVLAFGAVTASDLLGGPVTHHSVGALLAIFLIFYDAGAFSSERRAWLALILGLLALGADTVIASAGLSEFLFPAIFLLMLPWAVGRMLRERAERPRRSARSPRNVGGLRRACTDRPRVA